MMKSRNLARTARKKPQLEGVYMVSLGCPKNLVDSEIMAGTLITGGVLLNFDAASARYYLVNTCAFLPSAREESFAAIRTALAWKRRYPTERKVIVAGCLIQQDKAQQFVEQFPAVDYWSGVDGVPDILRALAASGGAVGGNPAVPSYLYDEKTPRLQFTLPHVAYLKIADGCNNRCTYCAIPDIRGNLRSRTIASVKREAENLLANGVSELILIAQDITVFGRDRAEGETLARLLAELDQLPGDFAVRLLYTHPAHFTDELIAYLGRSKHVLPYLDIPLQHINSAILTRMNRHVDRDGIETLLDKLTRAVPDLAIRTTFITGFPGEGEEEFLELEEFVRARRFARLGVFAYSAEPGTPAAAFADPVPTAIAEARAARLMALQKEISTAANRALIGRTLPVILDQAEGGVGWGRTEMDAPEIDNSVKVCSAAPLVAGKSYPVRIESATAFDLSGKVC